MSSRTTFRMTKQRRAILEQLQSHPTHPTADELYARVRGVLPRISLGTVYRNLEAMADRGMVLKLGAADAPKRFDGRAQAHYHVRCVRCGRVEDAPVAVLVGMEGGGGEATGYEVTGHQLEFIGLCPRCGDNGPAPPRWGAGNRSMRKGV